MGVRERAEFLETNSQTQRIAVVECRRTLAVARVHEEGAVQPPYDSNDAIPAMLGNRPLEKDTPPPKPSDGNGGGMALRLSGPSPSRRRCRC